MRRPDDWMPLHIGDYLADTTNLTRDQHGAYLLLIMAYWRKGEALPEDDGQLAAMAKASPAEWRKIKPVLAPLFRVEGGKWISKRCEEELAKARSLMAAKSRAGKEGAQKRWQKDGAGNGTGMADASICQRQNDAPLPQPIPKPEEDKISSFVVGRGRAGKSGVTIEDPNERIARFQKTIAQAIGKNGWTIVAAAADPASPDYEQALEVCRAAASRLGKGWPKLWPAPGRAA